MPDLLEFNTFSFAEFDFMGQGAVHDQLGAAKNTFKFKPTTDGKVEKIDGDLVSSITIIDKETFDYRTFKKPDVKRVNRKNEIVDGKDDLFLPLVRKGKYNLYGIPITMREGNQKYFSGLFMVFENPRENFAINPLEFSMKDMLNMSKMYERYETGMTELLKDCPEALAEMKKQVAVLKDKKSRKEANKEAVKEFQKFNAEVKMKLKDTPKEKRDIVESEMWTNYYLNAYTEGFNKVDEMCE